MRHKQHSLWHYLYLLWQELRLPVSLLILTFIGGALGYKFLYPDRPFYELLYMTAITLSTVGYGDILNTNQQPLTAFYTMSLLLVGMGTSVYAVSTLTAFFVEGALLQFLHQSQIARKIAKMHNHYIICGAGTTGVHVIREMHRCQVPFVVIDYSQERLHELQDEFPNLLSLVGDASHDDMLERANIQTCKGLVAALTNDKDNLFLTLTARQMNPHAKIVSKAVEPNIRRRLEIAGADYIVSPYYIGGMRMASEILRPHVVSFLDRMLRGQDNDIRINEVVVPENSWASGKALGKLEIYEHTGVQILALAQPENLTQYEYNPGPGEKVKAGSVLFFIGTPEQQQKIHKLLQAL